MTALALGRDARPRALADSALSLVALALVLSGSGEGDQWSPYHRISVVRPGGGDAALLVNGIPHQAMHPVNADGPAAEPSYDQVYQWFPQRRFSRALIVGAGSGTDVAYALVRPSATRPPPTWPLPNLIGATVGGVLEYGALLVGYQGLLVVVALIHGGAYLAGSRLRRFADRLLAQDPGPRRASARPGSH